MDYFEFENQVAVLLATNHKPVVQGTDFEHPLRVTSRYSSATTCQPPHALKHRTGPASPPTSAARVVGFGYPPRLIVLLYDDVMATSVHDGLYLRLLVPGLHHEPAGMGADPLVLWQRDLEEMLALSASALAEERCGRALLALPKGLLYCLVDLRALASFSATRRCRASSIPAILPRPPCEVKAS